MKVGILIALSAATTTTTTTTAFVPNHHRQCALFPRNSKKAGQQLGLSTKNEAPINNERSLYKDVKAMMNLSYLTYGLTTLNRNRELINPDKLVDPMFLRNLPKKSSEVLAWFITNEHVVESDIPPDVETSLDIPFLEDIVSGDDVSTEQAGDSTLEILDDEYAFATGDDAELVYAMTVNPNLKRIAITFRGSMTEKDFEQDKKIQGQTVDVDINLFKSAIPNPNMKAISEFEEVKIHSGFYEYLFKMKQKPTQGADADTKTKTKFAEIMDEVIGRLRQPEFEGYSIFVTGHSLGAALAILTAAAFAISDDVKETVTLISFAAPQVGKSNFSKAFESLEKERKVQHVRVSNNNDLITMGLAFFGYQHTGLHLNLIRPGWFNSKPYTLSKTKTGAFSNVRNGMTVASSWFTDFWHTHHLDESFERFKMGEDELEKLTIAGAYEDIMKV